MNTVACVVSAAALLCLVSLACAGCPESWFNCGNGRCIAMFWKCDGQNDCGNHRDEEGCPGSSSSLTTGDDSVCPATRFLCRDDSYCIPRVWLCDGEPDCHDSSDEVNCHGNCTGFQCKDKECIPEHWHCDLNEDCEDGTDELGCGNLTVSESSNSTCDLDSAHFLCRDGQCLPPQKVCDGKSDCKDGDDEASFCKVNECSLKKCSQGCYVTTNGSSCYCNTGFRLMADAVSCVDVDECSVTTRVCSHTCRNSPGSYRCSCLDGYTLTDSTFCKAKDPEPLMIFSDSKEIRGLWLRTNRYFAIHSAEGQAVGVEFDDSERRVYWTDVSTGRSAIHSSLLDGTGFKIVLYTANSLMEDLALDWVTNNLYVTDSALKRIFVCRVDGAFCAAAVATGVDAPRAIVLNPAETAIYWTDWGSQPAVMYANMDGTGVRALVSSDLAWPNGLALDRTISRLYWCDAKLTKIEYLDLLTMKRGVIIRDAVFHPFALAVFEDTLYWSDWIAFSLDSTNKFDSKHHHRILRENSKHIMGVHVYHPVLRSRDIFNPCWDNPCEDICVLATDGYACLCRLGYELSFNKHTCKVTRQASYAIVSTETKLYQVRHDLLTPPSVVELPVNGLHMVGAMAFDWPTQSLYLCDNSRQIIMTVNMTNFATRLIREHHIGSILGMDFDGQNQNLYWVDTDKHTLEACRSNGSGHVVLLNGLGRPLDVALYPKAGIMFVLSAAERPSIVRYTMDGRNSYRLELSSILLPLSLSMDLATEKLYWGDAVRGTIEYLDLRNTSFSAPSIVEQVRGHVMSVSGSHDLVHWTTREDSVLYYFDLSRTKPEVRTVKLPGNDTVARKVVYAAQTMDYGIGPCSINNGGCSHVCLPALSNRTCLCPSGMVLRRNNVTCTVENGTCSAQELKCGNVCIPSTYWCDGYQDCPDNSDEKNCGGSKCPANGFTCNSGKCLDHSWVCDGYNDCGDYSDETNCPPQNCTIEEYRCKNGTCISLYWRCDGAPDCPDKDDELECSNVECPSHQDRCANGQCIPHDWKCDRQVDCTDSSDEANCAAETDCIPGDFKCANKQCIDGKFACDHQADCDDGSDEIHCDYTNKSNATRCPKAMVNCGDGQCVYDHDMCDGYLDCHNQRDEDNCTIQQCTPREFFCVHTRRCILPSWLCDGEDDCGDNMDETLPACHVTTPPAETTTVHACWSDEFRCGSHECVPWSRVCDKHADCLDYSDEGSHCDTYCGNDNGGCAQVCRESPAGPKCSCNPGYYLTGDFKTCEDIDECQKTDHCSHFCTNTKGSFKCSCASGYSLGADKRYCKVQSGEALLVYLLPNEIRSLSMRGHAQHLLAKDDLADMHGLDYDFGDRTIYWAEMGEGTLNSLALSNNHRKTVLGNVHKPFHVGVDWVTKNLYFTDGWVHIQACESTFKYCTDVLDTGYQHVNSFSLAANEGIMFWSVWNVVLRKNDGVIERAYMDGSGRQVIVSDKILWPCSITVDHVHMSLYWADSNKNVIESASFDGKYRRTIVGSGVTSPFSIALFEDWLYWSDWGTDTLMASNRRSGREKAIVHHGNVKATALKIIHEAHQPSGINRCARNQCLHICLLTSTSYTCACGHGYNLSNDSHSCIDTDDGKPFSIDADDIQQPCNPECLNGGTCVQVRKRFACACPPEFQGPSCRIPVDVPQSSPVETPRSKWLASVLIFVLCTAFLVFGCIFYRRNRRRLPDMDFTVRFKKPTFGMTSEALLEGECPVAEDHDRVTSGEPGFRNPLYHETKAHFVAEDQGFHRWSSNDSVASSGGVDSPKTTHCTGATGGDDTVKQVFLTRKM